MMTKNPAPIPIANSVSNMIDPPDGAPAPGGFSVSIWAASWLFARVFPLGLPEPYLRLTLEVPGPPTRERRVAGPRIAKRVPQ